MTGIAAAKNLPPTATLTTNGASFSSGASIILNATAVDADVTIAGVKFYRGGTTLIGSGTLVSNTTSEPNFASGQTSFGVSLTYSALGVHQPVVIVTDMQGNVSRHPFGVRVNDPAILQQMFGSLWGRMLDNLKKGGRRYCPDCSYGINARSIPERFHINSRSFDSRRSTRHLGESKLEHEINRVPDFAKHA